MFHEYPKALYRGVEFTTVAGPEDEHNHRMEGWHDFGTSPAEMTDSEWFASNRDGSATKPRRGRPAKKDEK